MSTPLPATGLVVPPCPGGDSAASLIVDIWVTIVLGMRWLIGYDRDVVRSVRTATAG